VAIFLAFVGAIQAVYNSPMWAMGQRRYYFLLHAYAGLLLLGLVVLRLFFRAFSPWPKASEKTPLFAALVAGITHWTLYGLMLFVPVNGWIAASSFGCCVGVPGLPDINLLSAGISSTEPANAAIAYNLHRVLPWVLLALIMLHVAAALFHHFVVRDATLTSMLPSPARRRKRHPVPQNKSSV
jgi:cytochrome b561